jgi:hypothetical protein
MFELTEVEFDDLRSQFGTSSWRETRYMPMAFNEQCVAMLSSVLNSRRAIEVNILIMRTFVKMRQMFASHKDLVQKINEMEKKYNHQLQLVFEAIKALMKEEEEPKRKITRVGKEIMSNVMGRHLFFHLHPMGHALPCFRLVCQFVWQNSKLNKENI